MILDISKHQGVMDFKKTAARGVDIILCRCAYGAAKDVKFDSYAKSGAAAGISVGAYMFATWHYESVSKDFKTAKEHAAEQTKKALSFLEGKKITAPVAIDLELESGAKCALSKSELTQALNEALSIIEKAGYKAMLYCSVSWLYDRLEREKVKSPFWLAYYIASYDGENFPDTKYGRMLRENEENLLLWQYSSSGNGSYYGASSTYIDLNRSYGIEKYIKSAPDGSQSGGGSGGEEKASLYTVKIKEGSWNIRRKNSMSGEVLTVIKGGVSLQASKKDSGWYYLTKYKGWIGPLAVKSAAYNSKYVNYTVKKGDVLSKIAKDYGVTVDEIVELNNAKYKTMTRDYIQAGWVLKIPKR